jgi:hypothetical protein
MARVSQILLTVAQLAARDMFRSQGRLGRMFLTQAGMQLLAGILSQAWERRFLMLCLNLH